MRWENRGLGGVEALRRAPETAELHHPENVSIDLKSSIAGCPIPINLIYRF